jgi:hypothetical protein
MGGMRMQNAGNMGAASLEMMHIANQQSSSMLPHGGSAGSNNYQSNSYQANNYQVNSYQQQHHGGVIMGPDLKRSRAERDVMRVAANANALLPHSFHNNNNNNNINNNNYQGNNNNNNNMMQMNSYDNMMIPSHLQHLPMAKRQQLVQGMGGSMGGSGGVVGERGGVPHTTLNANGQPRKNHRRKTAAGLEHPPSGMGHHEAMGMGVGMEGLKGGMMMAGTGGVMASSSLNQQQQLIHLSQQQQAFAHQFQIKQQQQHHQQQQQQHQGRVKNSHISISAERRFFEQVKEVLTSSSREAWGEFVKCLELFTNDAMSKDDMLELVSDLFVGSPGSDLLHEFKRLLSSREDFDTHKSDAWYAVPLSEIDFTQCRKCTPSYRALPKDYPLSKCSERSEEESAQLNDEWVR